MLKREQLSTKTIMENLLQNKPLCTESAEY